MLTEFALLAALTLNADEREVLRDKINDWVKWFMPKLDIESTRSDKCRLVASVDRQQFKNTRNAKDWRFFKFDGLKVFIFSNDKKKLEEFKATSFQKKILRQNPRLENIYIGRSEIKEENGNWKLSDELKIKVISEGGEAIVFSEKFGKTEMAVRVQVFDPFLFTRSQCSVKLQWITHLLSDFGRAVDNQQNDSAVVPIHENVIKNLANVEIFDITDENREDCLGWITIMEKCDGNLQQMLKYETRTIDERKKIATGLVSGLDYLEEIGIRHLDRKLSNFLLIDDVVKVCDFGLVQTISKRKGYREMGYARKGSKYENQMALYAGTPGFSRQVQLIGRGSSDDNFLYHMFCDWTTGWSLIYRPIDDREKKIVDKIIQSCNVQNMRDTDDVIKNITKIISLPNSSIAFCLDDPNMMKSCQMSSLKQQMTKCVNLEMKNLTRNILDQKASNLSVPISITALIRFAMKNDLAFIDENQKYTFDTILTTLTMMVYPRSMAGLNLNPKKEESDFQQNDVENLLQRVCKKTYLRESGWEMIRKIDYPEPAESSCEFEKVFLNENFVFSRPLTVTGAYLFYPEETVFHQMTLDRIENGEYVLQNAQFSVDHPPVIRIKQKDPYYGNIRMLHNLFIQTGDNFYDDGIIKMRLVNETLFMEKNRWYLLPQAYSLTLTKI